MSKRKSKSFELRFTRTFCEDITQNKTSFLYKCGLVSVFWYDSGMIFISPYGPLGLRLGRLGEMINVRVKLSCVLFYYTLIPILHRTFYPISLMLMSSHVFNIYNYQGFILFQHSQCVYFNTRLALIPTVNFNIYKIFIYDENISNFLVLDL